MNNSKSSDKDQKRSFPNGVKWLLGVCIGLAAEKLLGPILNFFTDKFLLTGWSIANLISDLVYRFASNGFNDKNSRLILSIIAGSLIGFLLPAFTNKPKERELPDINPALNTFKDECTVNNPDDIAKQFLKESEKLKRLNQEAESREKKLVRILRVISVIIIIWIISILGFYSYADNIVCKTIGNIEIVSPYISDVEYKTLKSNFYSMDSKSDYDALMDNLNRIASNNSLKLK